MKTNRPLTLVLALGFAVLVMAPVVAQTPTDISQFVPDNSTGVVYSAKPARALDALQKFADAANMASMGMGNTSMMLDMASNGQYSKLKAFIDFESPLVIATVDKSEPYLVVKATNADKLATAAAAGKMTAKAFGAFVVLTAPKATLPKFPVAKSLGLGWAAAYAPDALVLRIGTIPKDLAGDLPPQVVSAMNGAIMAVQFTPQAARLDTTLSLSAIDASLGALNLSPRTDANGTRTMLNSLSSGSAMQLMVGGKGLNELLAFSFSPTMLKKWASIGGKEDKEFVQFADLFQVVANTGTYYPNVKDWSIVMPSLGETKSEAKLFAWSATSSLAEFVAGTRRYGDALLAAGTKIAAKSQDTAKMKFKLTEKVEKLADGGNATHLFIEGADADTVKRLANNEDFKSFAGLYFIQDGANVLCSLSKEGLERYREAAKDAIKLSDLAGVGDILKMLPLDAPILGRISFTELFAQTMGSSKSKGILPFSAGLFVAGSVKKGIGGLTFILGAKEVAWAISRSTKTKPAKP